MILARSEWELLSPVKSHFKMRGSTVDKVSEELSSGFPSPLTHFRCTFMISKDLSLNSDGIFNPIYVTSHNVTHSQDQNGDRLRIVLLRICLSLDLLKMRL